MPNTLGVKTHLDLIEALGGTFAVAALCNIKPPSVSGWKESGRIPDDKLMRLAPIAEARGITSRAALFPNDYWLIWPELPAPAAPSTAEG